MNTKIGRPKETNLIIEDHGDWLLVDISTPKHPNATMACDKVLYNKHTGGRIGAIMPPHSKYIYAGFYLNGENTQYHHYVMPTSAPKETDHKIHGSMDYIDNRLSNLRAVTSSQNAMNRSAQERSVSGHNGITWVSSSGKWRVRIGAGKRKKHLGYFYKLEDAIRARLVAEREMFGEYAFKDCKPDGHTELIRSIEANNKGATK